MPAGRPRTVSPSPEECELLGQELLEWATEQTGEFRFRFSQWYSQKKHILRKEWKKIIETPEFRPYYEEVQSIFATKCLNDYVKEGFAHRYLRLYDRDLVEDENDKAKHLSDLRKAENTALGSYLVETISYATHKNNTPTQV